MSNSKNKLLFKNRGYLVKENFLTREFCEKTLNVCENLNYNNNSIFNISCEQIKLNKNLKEIYNLIQFYLDKNIDFDYYFSNLKFITSLENHPKHDLPYIPHIDKNRYLKVFLYLHDVTEHDGPLTISENSDVKKNEEKRSAYWKKDATDEIKKYDLAFGEKSICKPQVYNAGTIITFDTNVSHLAGEVKKNRSRKILRFTFNFMHQSERFLNFKLRKFKSKLANQI